jgi:hypothetical protein
MHTNLNIAPYTDVYTELIVWESHNKQPGCTEIEWIQFNRDESSEQICECGNEYLGSITSSW